MTDWLILVAFGVAWLAGWCSRWQWEKAREEPTNEAAVEAVARAYHAEVGRRSGVNLSWDASYPSEQADFMRVTRKALLAAGFNVKPEPLPFDRWAKDLPW